MDSKEEIEKSIIELAEKEHKSFLLYVENLYEEKESLLSQLTAAQKRIEELEKEAAEALSNQHYWHDQWFEMRDSYKEQFDRREEAESQLTAAQKRIEELEKEVVELKKHIAEQKETIKFIRL